MVALRNYLNYLTVAINLRILMTAIFILRLTGSLMSIYNPFITFDPRTIL